ncbi:MAG: DUF504 domain-containing protein [Candidatus Nanoarchaeia archaeon]|jgi:uncharacterized protein (UPF0248 family)|nr:DUF504 domain-containing protein [Candidatus Nanoarchaeia archaeon]|tara:strand:- start:20488 stop:20715 length:228 start_codon:yes stop_codon:yes gene_type:complete
MIPIKDLINKIRWDKDLDRDGYLLHYVDRIVNSIKEIKFNEIQSIEGDFIVLYNKEVPLHRVRKVTKFGKVLWER